MPIPTNPNVNDPTIPTLGQRFKKVHEYATVLGLCTCQEGAGTLNLIICTQVGNVTTCGKCGWGYMIAEGKGPHGETIIAMVAPSSKTVM